MKTTLGFIIGALLLTGCMYSPRNGQTLSSRGELVSFAGYVPTDQHLQTMTVWCSKQASWTFTAQVITLPVSYSPSSELVDAKGDSWAPFGGSAVIPASCWGGTPGAYSTYVSARVPSGTVAATTFEVGSEADQCIQSYHEDGLGGFDIYRGCSRQNGIAVLYAAQ
jgi:hypothetical protein